MPNSKALIIYFSTSLGTCLAKLILSIKDLNTTLIKQKKMLQLPFIARKLK